MALISKKPMRRSALISPWGVGAIVPFPNDESLMIAGLDMWQYTDVKPFLIKDERLQKRLGVKELRWPPDFRDRQSDIVNYNLKIPADSHAGIIARFAEQCKKLATSQSSQHVTPTSGRMVVNVIRVQSISTN